MENKRTNRLKANGVIIALLTALMAIAVIFGGMAGIKTAKAAYAFPYDRYISEARIFENVSLEGNTLTYSIKSAWVEDFERDYYRLEGLDLVVSECDNNNYDYIIGEYGAVCHTLPLPQTLSGTHTVNLSEVLNINEVFPKLTKYSCFLLAYVKVDDYFGSSEHDPLFIDFGYCPSEILHCDIASFSRFNSVKIISAGNSLSHLQIVPVVVGDNELFYKAAEALTTLDRLTVVAGNPFASTDNYMSDSTVWGIIDGSPVGFKEIALEISSGSDAHPMYGAVSSISEMLGYMREHINAAQASKLEEILSSEYTFFFSKIDGTAFTYAVNVTPMTVCVPKKDGYTFVGWYKDEAYKQPFNGELITANMTLFAKYAPNICTVTYEVGAGTFDGAKTLTVDYGTSVTLPTPVCEGRVFLGWYIDGVKVETPYTVTDNVTLVAKWEIMKITVTFIAGGQVVSTVSVDYGTSLQTLAESEGLADCCFYSVDGVAYNMEKPITEDTELVIERHTVGGFIDGHMWVFWAAMGVLGAAVLSTVIASAVAHKRR